MGPSHFTCAFHSNCRESHTKTNNFLKENNLWHHMTPTPVSCVNIKLLYLNVFSRIVQLGGGVTKSCCIRLPVASCSPL